MVEGVNSRMTHLIYYKNFCKCHSVPPPSKTIEKKVTTENKWECWKKVKNQPLSWHLTRKIVIFFIFPFSLFPIRKLKFFSFSNFLAAYNDPLQMSHKCLLVFFCFPFSSPFFFSGFSTFSTITVNVKDFTGRKYFYWEISSNLSEWYL
jgi:hypothetical protein